jgi:hypothetical protein
MRVINGIPLGRPLALIVAIINYVETLKALMLKCLLRNS